MYEFKPGQPKEEFSYFISQKSQILVVSLVGNMDAKALAPLSELKELHLLQPTAKIVILNFRGVQGISAAAIPQFVQLQTVIRKHSKLMICGVKTEIQEQLARKGVIRARELTIDLQNAIEMWASQSKNIA